MGPSSVSVTLGTAMHMLKHTHKPKASFFLQAPGCATPQQLNESQQTGFALSSLLAFPRSCVNLQNGKRTPRYTHLAKEATLGLSGFSSCSLVVLTGKSSSTRIYPLCWMKNPDFHPNTYVQFLFAASC